MSPHSQVPKVYTIASWQVFLDNLVSGLIDRYWDPENPLAFSDITILVPTRRAVRSIVNGFADRLKAMGEASLLLPAIRPIGDVDEDELIFSNNIINTQADIFQGLAPAISEYKRQFLLTKLIHQWFVAQYKSGVDQNQRSLSEAFAYAIELATFLNTAQTDKVDLAKLKNIVADNFAEHWQQTVGFLKIIDEVWPNILNSLHVIDPADRRNRMIESLANHWQATTPTTPIIAAGSTGSIKSTARLLSVIARLPQGAVILPGLDKDLDEKSWDLIDIQHPQYGLKELLLQIGTERAEIKSWTTSEQSGLETPNKTRTQFISEALRPAQTTESWREAVDRFEAENWAEGLYGLTLVEADDEHEEAGIISILLREAYEEAGKTAALVTPDRELARRVSANLARWNIEIDDSAGKPFLQSWPGTFLKQLIECVVSNMDPVLFLNLAKHPFFRCGRPRAQIRHLVNLIEIHGLRRFGGRMNWRELSRHLIDKIQDHEIGKIQQADFEAAIGLLSELEALFQPMAKLIQKPSNLSELAEAHIRLADGLAAEAKADEEAEGKPTPENAPLWMEEAGETAANLMRDLYDNGTELENISIVAYSDIFSSLAAKLVVRKVYGIGDRLSIWGPLEARLQKADLIILSGLNEGSWPTYPSLDPWASRPMREAIGMELPERRIGLSAHDFSQLAVNGEVVLTRSIRAAGAPTVASRWLMRLKAILQGANAEDMLQPAKPYAQWWYNIDRALNYNPAQPPRPCPSLPARPRSFSVSEVQKWLRDPYSIYAKKILGLKPLEPLAKLPDAGNFGDCVHQIFCDYVKRQSPAYSIEERMALMAQIVENTLAAIEQWPHIHTLWAQRLKTISQWFIEYDLHSSATKVYVEVSGDAQWPLEAGPLSIHSRADRINLTENGLEIIDYKTGNPPTKKQVEAQLEPQLTLEAIIAAKGGFPDIEAAPIFKLNYIRLSGRAADNKELVIAQKVDKVAPLLEKTEIGLLKWARRFDEPSTPYLSRPRVQLTSAYGDYDHLARVKEWSATGKDGDND